MVKASRVERRVIEFGRRGVEAGVRRRVRERVSGLGKRGGGSGNGDEGLVESYNMC